VKGSVAIILLSAVTNLSGLNVLAFL